MALPLLIRVNHLGQHTAFRRLHQSLQANDKRLKQVKTASFRTCPNYHSTSPYRIPGCTDLRSRKEALLITEVWRMVNMVPLFYCRWGIKILPSVVQHCVCARCCHPGGTCSTEIEMLGVLFLAGMHLIIIFVALFTIVSTTFNQAPVRGDLHIGYSRMINTYL